MDIRVQLMSTLYNRGRYSEAIHHGMILSRLGVNQQRVYYLLARALEKTGDPGRAMEFLEKTVAMDAKSSEGITAARLLNVLKRSTGKEAE